MAKANTNPDLTMLALAAYEAIRRDMEEGNGKERTLLERVSAQPDDRLRDRIPDESRTHGQQTGCRLIAI